MCAFVFYMSALPADDSTALSDGVIWQIVGFVVPGYDQLSAAEQLQWQEALQNPVRKTAHFLEYAVLGALMLNLVRQARKTQRAEFAANGPRVGEDAAIETSVGANVASGAFRNEGPGESQWGDASSPAVSPSGSQSGQEADSIPGSPGRRDATLAWALTVAYAATDELHQLFVPGRAGRLSDIGIDTAGALLGIALLLLVLRAVRR